MLRNYIIYGTHESSIIPQFSVRSALTASCCFSVVVPSRHNVTLSVVLSRYHASASPAPRLHAQVCT